MADKIRASATAVIVGRAGRDWHCQTSASGKKWGWTSVCVEERRKVDGEWKTVNTVWYKVTLWDDPESFDCAKGQWVRAEGRLTIGTYVGKEDGKTYIDAKVSADKLEVLDDEGNVKAQPKPAEAEQPPDEIEEDLPF